MSYENSDQDYLLNVEVQGKGDVASLWCLMSHKIINDHGKLNPPIEMPRSTLKKSFKKNNDAFIEDTDGQRDMGVKQKMKQLNHYKIKCSHGRNL